MINDVMKIEKRYKKKKHEVEIEWKRK